MKKALIFFAIITLATAFISCSDDDDSSSGYDITVQEMGSVDDIGTGKILVDSSTMYTVTLEAVSIGSGSYKVYDKASGNEITDTTSSLARGTVLQIVSTPADGYILDLAYQKTVTMWPSFDRSSPKTTYEFPLYTDNVFLGAAFITEEKASGYEMYSNIKYGETPEKHLIYDVYVPSGLSDGELLPIVFIIHGGGWSAGDPSVMIQMARQMAKSRKYVVCALNYRFLGTADGNTDPYDINEQIEDCFGGIAHFLNLEPEKYHADITRFTVTGDSAGGHLSACMGTMFDMIGTAGFDGTNFEFWPTGLAEEDVPKFKEEFMAGIKAMAPTYGVPNLEDTFNLACFPGNASLPDATEAMHKVSPYYVAPTATIKVPCWQIRGTLDGPPIFKEDLEAFQTVLKNAGWADDDNQYLEVDGASHAFFDWKLDSDTQATYAQYGEPNVDVMMEFFDKYVAE